MSKGFKQNDTRSHYGSRNFLAASTRLSVSARDFSFLKQSPYLSAPSALKPNPPCQPPSLADIVREETDDGRLIVRFLIDVHAGQPRTLPALSPTRRRPSTPEPWLPPGPNLHRRQHPAAPTRKNSAPSALSAVKPSPPPPGAGRPHPRGNRQRPHHRPLPNRCHAGQHP